jgi:hypothetical protein
MESSNNFRDFEQFVKQNADQYRMFPSEKVWKGIHTTLHTRRRWYSLGLGLLLLITASGVTWLMLNPSTKNQKVAVKQSSAAAQVSSPAAAKDEDKPAIFNSPSIIISSKKTNTPQTQAHLTDPFSLENTISNLRDHGFANPGPAFLHISSNAESFDHVMKEESFLLTPIDARIIDQATDNDPIAFLMNQNAPSIFERMVTAREDRLPLTIESVINAYKYKAIRRKLSWQVYFVPTISYRKLTENATFLRSAQSNNSPYSYAALHDVNSAVTHKPDMGLEFGLSVGYPLTKNLTLIGGLQFNVSKYDIRAYAYTSEVAIIALSSGAGTNSVSSVSNYRNFGGYSSNWLHNLYFSVSAPLGAELKVAGGNKTYLGISATLQPTYVLSDRAYLISTDYKNYAKVPSLIRKWNLNSSFETFAGYSTGKIKWKVGPQVRYQVLSSFQEKYPVREHLFDYGLKIGIMLNK